MKRSDRNNPRMNGHSPAVNGFADGSNDSARCSTDIRRHIKELSTVTGPDLRTQFVPVQGPGREELDRMKIHRKVRTPRNAKLYNDDSEDGSENRSYTSDDYFDENELRANLRSALGGEICSNRKIEQRWRFPETSATLETPRSNVEGEKEEKPNGKQANNKLFANNLLMRSIVNRRMEVNGDAAINFNQEPENVGENSCSFNLIPDSIEPDFFYREIRSTRPDDDFIVEHIGKVTSVTPRQFLIHNIEPTDFEFSRKKKH